MSEDNKLRYQLRLFEQLLNVKFTYDPLAHVYSNANKPADSQHLSLMGARSAEPADPRVVGTIAIVLEHLKKEGRLLTQNGFADGQEEMQNALNDGYDAKRIAGTLLDVRAIQLAMTDIQLMICEKVPAHLDDVRVYAPRTSYSLKHHLEHYREARDRDPYRKGYITNGDFIMAMLLLGYEMKHKAGSSRSAIFKCCSLVEEVKFVPGYSKREFSGTYISKPKYDLYDY